MSNQFETVCWFSLALDYGLSFVSLGRPGTQGADAQLITGGLTAVESLLGTEIGAKTEGFVVDHGTSLMERFPIKTKEGQSGLFAQFLLQTTKPGEQVDRDQVPIARKFISELAKVIVETKLWESLQISAQMISPIMLYDTIISVYEQVHNEFKLRPIGNSAQESLVKILEDTFNVYDYSETLHKLSNMDIEKVDSYIKENHVKIFIDFSKEVVSKFIQEFPLIFLYTSPKFIKNEVENLIKDFLINEIDKIEERIIYDLIKEFFDVSMHEVIKQFDIEKIRDERDQLRKVVASNIKTEIIKKYPLLILANPTLKLKGLEFETIIDKKVLDKVFIEYDLGEVLSKIAGHLILEANHDDKLQSNLVKDFFSNLGLRFPGGLPDQLWHILIQLLKIYSAESKVDLARVNQVLDIPDVHWTTVKNRFDNFKPSPVVQFRGESGQQVIHFFEAVREAIGRSFDKYYNEFIWNIKAETFGRYYTLLNEECIRIFQSFLTTKHLIGFLNTLVSSNKFKLFNPIALELDHKKFVKFLTDTQYKGSRSQRLFSGFSEYDDNNLVKFMRSEVEAAIKNELKKIKKSIESVENYKNYLDTFVTKIGSTEIKSMSKLMLKESTTHVLPEELYFFNDKEIDKIRKEIDKIDQTVFQDFKDKFNEFQRELQGSDARDSKNYAKLTKKKEKLVDILSKIIEKGKISEFMAGIDKSYLQSIGMLDSEFDEANKEYDKFIEKESIKQLKLGIVEGKVVGTNTNLDNIKEVYIKEENKKYKGDAFIKDNDFLYAFSSAFLFDSLDNNISKKALNLAIFEAKSSKLIMEVIERGKEERKNDDTRVIDFLGHLKDELIETGIELFSLSKIITNHIKKSVVSEDFPLKIIVGQYETLALPIDSLDEKFKTYIDKKIQIHPKLHLSYNEKTKKVDVAFEIAQRPSVGNEIEYLMDAVAINVYNNELLRMGSYIESLKLVSSALGENERRQIQTLFSMLGQHITS